MKISKKFTGTNTYGKTKFYGFQVPSGTHSNQVLVGPSQNCDCSRTGQLERIFEELVIVSEPWF